METNRKTTPKKILNKTKHKLLKIKLKAVKLKHTDNKTLQKLTPISNPSKRRRSKRETAVLKCQSTELWFLLLRAVV